LSNLDTETKHRIEPVILRAARTAYVRENRTDTFEAFRNEHPIFRWILNLSLFFIVYFVVGWWAFSQPFEKVPLTDRTNASFGAAATLVILYLGTRRLIGRREGYSGRIKVAAAVFGMVCLLTATSDWWVSQLLRITALPSIQDWHFGDRPIASMAGSAMLESTVTALVRMTLIYLFFEFGRAAVLAGQTARSQEYASATLLNSVLEIAAQLEETVANFSRQSESSASQESTLSYSYLWLPEREKLIRLLEKTARFVESYWGHNNRSVDYSVNAEIQRVADGIAAALRRWKPTAAVGGTENLQQMSSAFAIAVTNCADGEWTLLASEVSSREVLGKRVMKSIRRIIALSVLIAAILVTLLRPFDWTQGLKDPAVGTFFMLAAAFIAGLFDPTIYDRMAPATKLGSDLLAKRGG
jgi:uncharacterized membrane protein (DUF485 family)